MPSSGRSTARVATLLPLLKLLFVSTVGALPQHVRNQYGLGALVAGHNKDSHDANSKSELWIYLISAGVLVLLGGAFAGLTIALMGQDEIYLQVMATSGEGAERTNAAKVLNLLQKGKHWVLVSLLLSNVITNETLPIMLDRSLGGGWQAVIGSTILIVIFGEIVPQSICVRYGLPIGAVMTPFVLLLMWILAPVAWPVAKLLDFLLGEDHGTTYKKAGLKTLVTLHRTLGTSPDERLNRDEVTIISAVLDLKEKPIGSIMTPMEDVFTLSADAVLDEEMIDTILSEGYSRIPIHAIDTPENFIGMLLVKMLIAYDPEDGLKVHDFQLATLPETRPETSCLDIINFFQEGKSHMILVSESPGEPQGVLGVVTLEDVIEELIGEEIVDESDVFVDVHKAIRRLHNVPYYRIPKPGLGDIKENGQDQDGGTASKPTMGATMERKLSAISDSGSRTQAAKLMRRKHSGGTEPFNMSRKPDDIRAHLKHLGPSNLASKPKTTRFNAVKIKPGQQNPTSASMIPQPCKSTSGEIVIPSSLREASGTSRSYTEDFEATRKARELQAHAEETTGLLSAGFSAKDGTHAVGYGTVPGNLANSIRSFSENGMRSLAAQPSSLRQSEGSGVINPTKEDPPAEDSTQEPEAPTKTTSQSSDHGRSSPSHPSSSKENVSPKSSPSWVAKIKTSPQQAVLSNEESNASSASLPAKLVIELDNSPSSSEDEAANPDESSSGNTVHSTPSAGGAQRSAARSGSIHERGIDLGGLRKVVLDVRQDLDDVDENGNGGGGSDGDANGVSETTALLTQEASDQATDKAKIKKRKKKSKKRKSAKTDKEDGASPVETGEASEGVQLLK